MHELIDLEHRGWQALSTSGDHARQHYDASLADETTMVLPGGLLLTDRSQILDSMSGLPWERFELTDEQVLSVTAEVAVVAYRAVAERAGQPPYEALCTSTYVRDGDRWWLRLHQQTPVSA